MSDLEIPDASYRAMLEAQDDWEDDEILANSIREVAAPIAAAELRRLADELDVVRAEMREVDNRTIRSSGLGAGITAMRARADELDGGQS